MARRPYRVAVPSELVDSEGNVVRSFPPYTVFYDLKFDKQNNTAQAPFSARTIRFGKLGAKLGNFICG